LKRVVKSHAKKVYCARWKDDSLHIVTAGQEGNVLITNASTGVIVKMPIVSKFVMQCAAYGNLAASGGMSNNIDIWDISETKPVMKKALEGHEGYLSQIHFMAGGKKIALGLGRRNCHPLGYGAQDHDPPVLGARG